MRQTGILFLVCVLAGGLVCALGCDSPPAPGASAPAVGTQAPSAVPARGPFPAVDVGPAAVEALHEHTAGGTADEALPLVVVIHGLGDTPAAFWRLFQGFPRRAHFVVPAGGLKWGDGFAWWPITGEINENNMAAGMDAATPRLMAAIRTWRGSRVVGRPIVAGFSQGGMLSFALAAKYPAEIAAAVPVSGMLPAPMVPVAWPPGAPQPHIVALHGDADTRVPFAFGQRTVASLRALGVDVELKAYPGVGHSISAEMRRDLFAELGAAIEREAKASP